MHLLALPTELIYEISSYLTSSDLLSLSLTTKTLTAITLPLYRTAYQSEDRDGIPAMCRAVMTNTLTPLLLSRLRTHRKININQRYDGVHGWRMAPQTSDITQQFGLTPPRGRHWWWIPGATALYMAVSIRDEAAVRLLLANGADVHDGAGTLRRNTPLYEAIVPKWPGGIAMVRVLLEAGANARDSIDRKRGRKPLLHVAVLRGMVGITRLLLEYGADPRDKEMQWGGSRGLLEPHIPSGGSRGLWERQIPSRTVQRLLEEARKAYGGGVGS